MKDLQEMTRRVQAQTAALSTVVDDPSDENKRLAVEALDALLVNEAEDSAVCLREGMPLLDYDSKRGIRDALAS